MTASVLGFSVVTAAPVAGSVPGTAAGVVLVPGASASLAALLGFSAPKTFSKPDALYALPPASSVLRLARRRASVWMSWTCRWDFV